MWFAGNQGIFQVSERDFDDLANGLITRVSPVVYGRSEGLPGLQASFDFYPDSLRSSNDLFFSMLSGLAEVQLDYARLNYQPPKVFHQTHVIADDQTIAVYQDFSMASPTNKAASVGLNYVFYDGKATKLRLPPGLQQVQFEFTALSFVSPENDAVPLSVGRFGQELG